MKKNLTLLFAIFILSFLSVKCEAQLKGWSFVHMVQLKDTLYAEVDTVIFNINFEKSELRMIADKSIKVYQMSDMLSSEVDPKLSTTTTLYRLSNKDGKILSKISYLPTKKNGLKLTNISMIWSNVTLLYMIE
jgi:hypothetical protein